MESVVSGGEAAAGSAAMNGMSGLLTCELSFILWLESAPPVLFFVAVTIKWLEASNKVEDIRNQHPLSKQ